MSVRYLEMNARRYLTRRYVARASTKSDMGGNARGTTVDGMATDADTRGVTPQTVFGAQENLENIVDRYI